MFMFTFIRHLFLIVFLLLFQIDFSDKSFKDNKAFNNIIDSFINYQAEGQ